MVLQGYDATASHVSADPQASLGRHSPERVYMSNRHGCTRDLWTWNKEEKSLLLQITNKYWYSCVPLGYVTVEALSDKDRKSYT